MLPTAFDHSLNAGTPCPDDMHPAEYFCNACIPDAGIAFRNHFQIKSVIQKAGRSDLDTIIKDAVVHGAVPGPKEGLLLIRNTCKA